MFTNFHNVFLAAFNVVFPEKEKEIKINKTKATYVQSVKLAGIKRILDMLYTIIKVRSKEDEQQLYNTLKREYRKEVIHEKRKSVAERLASSDNKMQDIWNIINLETNNKANKNNDDSIILNAHELNEYFSSIGDILANAVTSPTQDAFQFLQRERQGVAQSIYLERITAAEIVSITAHLKKKGAQDVYGLSIDVVEYVIEHIANTLTTIINASIVEDIFLTELKVSKITPIHKKGKKNGTQ